MSFWEALTLVGTAVALLVLFLTLHALMNDKILSSWELLILAGTMATILGLFLTLYVLILRRR